MTDDDIRLAAALIAAEDRPKDVLDEVPPAEKLPEDPEIQRLQAEVEELAPFRPLIEAIGRRELIVQEAPPPGPAIPDPTPVFEYRQRITSPDAPAVIEEMKLYQEQLKAVDPEAAQRLDDDPSFFVETYDKLRSLRPAPAQPTPSAPRRDPQELERILAAREIRKDAARSERAGIVTGGSEAFGGGDRVTDRDRAIVELKMRIRRDPGNTDLQAQLAKFYLGDD